MRNCTHGECEIKLVIYFKLDLDNLIYSLSTLLALQLTILVNFTASRAINRRPYQVSRSSSRLRGSFHYTTLQQFLSHNAPINGITIAAEKLVESPATTVQL